MLLQIPSPRGVTPPAASGAFSVPSPSLAILSQPTRRSGAGAALAMRWLGTMLSVRYWDLRPPALVTRRGRARLRAEGSGSTAAIIPGISVLGRFLGSSTCQQLRAVSRHCLVESCPFFDIHFVDGLVSDFGLFQGSARPMVGGGSRASPRNTVKVSGEPTSSHRSGPTNIFQDFCHPNVLGMYMYDGFQSLAYTLLHPRREEGTLAGHMIINAPLAPA